MDKATAKRIVATTVQNMIHVGLNGPKAVTFVSGVAAGVTFALNHPEYAGQFRTAMREGHALLHNDVDEHEDEVVVADYLARSVAEALREPEPV